jgi:YD repeat-containing protein
VATRLLYDADGHVVARFYPSAFATSTQTPDATFMTRADVDANGQTTAVFVPRYDAGAPSDLGLSGTQTGQCPTNPSPQSVIGVPGYPSGVGVCTVSATYYLDELARTIDDGARSSLYTYDGSGQRAARADQVDGTATRSTTTYAYGDAPQLVSMSAGLAGTNPTSFSYDAAGRLL